MRPSLAYLPSPSQGVWHIGAIPLRAYALCIIAGIVVAIWMGERRWQARGGSPGTVSDVAVLAVIFGLIGGRVYHVATDPELYFGDGKHPADVFKVWEGGLGIWGAISLGAVGAWIGCRARGISLRTYADVVVPGVAVAQAIGRFGNWFNQELFGKPTTLPWGLKIDPVRPNTVPGAEAYHPTFLYEAIWDVGLAGVLIWAERRFKLGRGRVIALYVMGYPLGRIWIESLRIDTTNHIFGLRLNIWTCIIVFAAGLVLFLTSTGPREEIIEPATATAAAADDAEATGTGTAVEADSAVDTEAEPAVGTEAEPAADTEVDSAADTEAEPAADTEAEPAPAAGSDAGGDAEPAATAEADAATPDAETKSDTPAEAGTPAVAGAPAVAGSAAEAGSEAEADRAAVAGSPADSAAEAGSPAGVPATAGAAATLDVPAEPDVPAEAESGAPVEAGSTAKLDLPAEPATPAPAQPPADAETAGSVAEAPAPAKTAAAKSPAKAAPAKAAPAKTARAKAAPAKAAPAKAAAGKTTPAKAPAKTARAKAAPAKAGPEQAGAAPEAEKATTAEPPGTAAGEATTGTAGSGAAQPDGPAGSGSGATADSGNGVNAKA